MSRLVSKRNNITRRKNRVRTMIRTNSGHPRLSVNISNRHILAQVIDDSAHKTLISVSTEKQAYKGNMTEKAGLVGKEIAEKAKAKKIKQVVLDRGSRLYHGRIKVLADAAREEGLVI